jgi:hypothetical protein
MNRLVREHFHRLSGSSICIACNRMNYSLLCRQAALASYGTLFLSDRAELETWYRHGLFWESRFQFRDAAQRLVANDFTEWLGGGHHCFADNVSGEEPQVRPREFSPAALNSYLARC